MVNSAASRLLFLAFTLPAAAGADLFVRYLPYPPPAEGKIHDNLDVYVSGGKVLMTGKSATGIDYSVWYDSADRTFRVHDASRGGYFKLNAGFFAGLEGQQKQYRRDLEAKLADTPEAERPAMRDGLEQFEKSIYGGAPPERFEYRNTGTRGVEAGIECLEHEVLQAGRLVRRLCITGLDQLGMDDQDLAALESMSREGARIAFGTRRGFQLIPVYPLDLNAGFVARARYLESGQELRLSHLDRNIPRGIELDSYTQQLELPLQFDQ